MLAKSTDARQKLQKIRNFKEGKVSNFFECYFIKCFS